MTNELINMWSTVLINTAEKLCECEKVDILLLLDTYTARWNEGFQCNNENKSVLIHRKKIPKRTTYRAQQLDTYFNRELK